MTFDPPTSGPLWLASRSPRRRRLLEEAGVPVRLHHSSVDDGRLRRGAVTPAEWVMALAYLKARAAADALVASGERQGTVLGADTVCVRGDEVLGQPADLDEARRMLHAFRGTAHETVTGVCLIALGAGGGRWLLVDRSTVRVGDLPEPAIESYLATEAWRGKAGGYNLADRLAAGWPIACDGDPATVMGLPMRRLETWLARVRGAA